MRESCAPMLMKEQNRLRMQRTRSQEQDVLLAIESKRTGLTREEYAEWLKGYNWDYFMTVTFRKAKKEPYYALESVYRELRNFYVARAFLGCEPHQSGDLHIHGILSGAAPGWKPEISLPWEIWNGLFKRFGRSKVEACNSAEAVSSYCAKYILKQQSRVCDYYAVYGSPLDWRGGLLDKAG